MAAKGTLHVKTEPRAVMNGGKSRLTATLIDEHGKLVPGQEIVFNRKKDGADIVIGKAKTAVADGAATVDFDPITEPSVAKGNEVIVWATSDALRSDDVKIGLFETQAEADFDDKLKQLAVVQQEQQEQERRTAAKASEVQNLKQQIDSLVKTPASPPEIGDTKTAYEKAFNGFKTGLADANGKLTEIETLISAQIDKPKRDGIVAQVNQIDVDIKALTTRIGQLDTEVTTLKARVTTATEQLKQKREEWESFKGTRVAINRKLKECKDENDDLLAAVKEGVNKNDKVALGQQYLKLLETRGKVGEINRLAVEPAALEKNLAAAWQQIIAKKQELAKAEYELEQKENEKNQENEKLANRQKGREEEIKTIIDKLVK